MRKTICILLSFLLFMSLAACGENEVAPPEEESNEPIYYEGHGIKMEIPAIWEDTFVSYYKEFGEGSTAYTSLEFYTIINGDEAGVLTIASFNEESWELARRTMPEAEDMKIGTSSDGKTHYTIRFADTKFENSADQEKFDRLVEKAKEKKDTIQILN